MATRSIDARGPTSAAPLMTSSVAKYEAHAVLVDALMLGALCAAEASPVPTGALFHTAYCLFRGGPLLDMVSAGDAIADAVASILADPGLGVGAKQIATAIAGYSGSSDAVAELERLASP